MHTHAHTSSGRMHGTNDPCACWCCCWGMQAVRLREAEPALQKAAERAAAAASVTDKVGLNAAAEERKAKLRQQEVRTATAAGTTLQMLCTLGHTVCGCLRLFWGGYTPCLLAAVVPCNSCCTSLTPHHWGLQTVGLVALCAQQHMLQSGRPMPGGTVACALQPVPAPPRV